MLSGRTTVWQGAAVATEDVAELGCMPRGGFIIPSRLEMFGCWTQSSRVGVGGVFKAQSLDERERVVYGGWSQRSSEDTSSEAMRAAVMLLLLTCVSWTLCISDRR